MKTIQRLIYKEIVSAVGFVIVGFLGLFFFFDLIDELQWVGKGVELNAAGKLDLDKIYLLPQVIQARGLDQVPSGGGAGYGWVFGESVVINAGGVLAEFGELEAVVVVGDFELLAVAQHQKTRLTLLRNSPCACRGDGLAIALIAHDEDVFALFVTGQVFFDKKHALTVGGLLELTWGHAFQIPSFFKPVFEVLALLVRPWPHPDGQNED